MYDVVIYIKEKEKTKQVADTVSSKRLRALRTIHGSNNVVIIVPIREG